MPAALKKPTLDELYRRLRDLDYTQIDERMAIMLNAILQLEDQGECRESATEAVLMIGYTTEGISNQEQTRWLSWNVDGGVKGFDLARNPGLNNNTEYGAGEFPLPTRPTVRSTSQSSSRVPSMSRTQQTTEAYPDLGVLKKELRRPLEVEREIEVSTSSTSEEDFKPQKINVKRGSTNGQTWEVDVGKEWISKAHQATGKRVTSDPLERNKTRNTSRMWWVALETLKEMEDC